MDNSLWNVTSQDGQDGFNALELSNAPVPELGASQVLVKLQAASLNYRDLIIPLDKYPFKTSPNVIPGSDGAGTVIAVGSQVSRFKPGDKGLSHNLVTAGQWVLTQGSGGVSIFALQLITGFVDGEAEVQPGFFDCLMNLCTARGLMVGSRAQVEDMCRAIETNPKILQPVVNKKRFKLEDVKEAYEYQWSGKHVGKVCIEIA
ncbi:hypothetical protein G3M48_008197 [Beauveria asiatica]|uniref:Enoyl reductase (ER) domain-containing protein n=1 Tax=Beauveria asiatica TaxID=1069075 RepID=A0AAW0RLI8_9HYPO